MSEPLVTTIIPSYNHAQYIEKAMQSVLDQDYPNSELIVVDDGSNDQSHAVIRAFAAQHPEVTTILNAENRGQSAVFDQGLRRAQGEFIQLLPSDDWYLPGKTRLQVRKFLDSGPGVGVVYGRGYRFFESTGETVDWTKGPLRKGNIFYDLIIEGNFVYPVTPMFRRECFERVQLDTTFRAEGEAIYPKIARHFEFDFVEAHVAVMRDHGYNIGKDAAFMYSELNRYYDKVFGDPELSAEIANIEPMVRARHHRTKGIQLVVRGGDRRLGRASLITALQYRPVLMADPKVIAALLLSFFPSRRGQRS